MPPHGLQALVHCWVGAAVRLFVGAAVVGADVGLVVGAAVVGADVGLVVGTGVIAVVGTEVGA